MRPRGFLGSIVGNPINEKLVPTAWANIQTTGGGASTVKDSIGITSLTDSGTGDLTLTFQKTTIGTAYCVFFSLQQSTAAIGDGDSMTAYIAHPALSKGTASLRVLVTRDNNSADVPDDSPDLSVMFMGSGIPA